MPCLLGGCAMAECPTARAGTCVIALCNPCSPRRRAASSAKYQLGGAGVIATPDNRAKRVMPGVSTPSLSFCRLEGPFAPHAASPVASSSFNLQAASMGARKDLLCCGVVAQPPIRQGMHACLPAAAGPATGAAAAAAK